MKLRVYDMVINDNDETGVDINSFVDAPAHMRGFATFGKNKMTFAVDEEKRIVTGVAIMADFLIYRNDRQLGEHYVKFSPKVIWDIRNKFFKNGFGNSTNVQHATMVTGATLVDSFIVHSSDPRFPKVPEILAGQKVNDGSWVVSYYVENEKLWQDCKNGIFKGFSVEGYFDKVETRVKTNMKKTKVVEGRFAQIAQVIKWSQVVDQDSFEVGNKLTTTYENSIGEKITGPLSSGEYTTEDGKQFLVDSNGTIRLVFNKQSNMKGKNTKKASWFQRNIFGEAAEEVMSEATTVDGVVLFYDGDLAVGTQVNIEVDGEQVAAPEGDHQVDIDGVTYAITLDAEGKVATMEEVTQMSEEATLLSAAMKKIYTDANSKFAAMQKEIDQLKADLKVAQSGGKFSADPKKTGADKGEGKKGWKSLV